MDRNSFAIRGLFRTLRDNLPAKLAAKDASRAAYIVCTPGPYTIPVGGTLIINGGTYNLTSGTRTTAQVAADLAAVPGVTASADADGALVLTSTSPPAAGATSSLTIGAGTANAALGLTEGDSNVVRVAVSAPAVRFLERTVEPSDCANRLAPVVGLSRDPFNPGANLNSDLSDVQVRLLCLLPGPANELAGTLQAVKELAGAIYEVVAEGDGRGTYLVGRSYANDDGKQLVVCRPNAMTIEPTVITGQVAGAAPLTPIGQAFPAFTIQVFDAT